MPKLSQNRISFTKQKLANLPVSEKDTHYHDEGQKGLMIIVRSSGAKTFWVRYYINGREYKYKIGSFATVTIETARNRALDFTNNAAKGINLADKEKAIRDEPTLGDLCYDFIENHSKRYKKSGNQDITEIPKHFGKWYNKRASEITRSMIADLHLKLCGENKVHATGANRIYERINAVYNRAITMGIYNGINPAKGIKKFKERSRNRILTDEEYPRFVKSLVESEHRDAKDIILVALLTGIRKGNILSMRWDCIDFEQKIPIWHIPDTKNGNPQDVVLIPITVELLLLRKALQANNPSPFVFPGEGKKGHLVDPKRAVKSILESAEIKDFRIHDLRRTLATTLNMVGASDLIIKKILGHVNYDVTAIYVRPENETILEMLTKAWETTLKRFTEFNKWW